MMQIEEIVNLCDDINERLKIVTTTIEKNNAEFLKDKKDIEETTRAMKLDMEVKIRNKIEKDVESLKKNLADVEARFGSRKSYLVTKGKQIVDLSSYSSQLNQISDESEKLDFERETLYNTFRSINDILKSLDSIDFDKLNPQLSFQINEDTLIVKKGDTTSEVGISSPQICANDLDTNPADSLLIRLFSEIDKADKILQDIKQTSRNVIDYDGYAQSVEDSKNHWIEEEKAATETKNKEVIYEQLEKETEKLSRTTFSIIEDTGRKSEPDLQCGSDKFSTTITLGKLSINVTENPEYIQLLKESSLLKDYLSDGNLKIPFIIDLKEKGNIWLNVNEPKFEKETFNFIHQVVLQFLLAFPPGRLNLCFIDVDDMGDFAKYTKLNAINSGMLCDGITREVRSLDDVLMAMGKRMNDTYDDKICYSDCTDFYQYNKISEADPQSATLIVLLNYPKGMREDENQRLLRLMTNGNRSGIFTFVVNNSSCELASGVKEEDHKQLVEKLSDSAVIINKVGSQFKTQSKFKHTYNPENGVTYEKISDVIKLLIDKAKDGLHVVIPLEDMFADTDTQMAGNKIPPVSEVLDLPIGKRGREIQNLLLDSTGEGSAHAVVIGGTGSGKSNLLHTIITNACYKYSPDDLHIYLVDFKGGVEFKFYERNTLPHVKLAGLTSEPEDGVAIISNVHKEMHRREDLFRQHSVEDIVQFRKKFPNEKIPRLLVIIDEVQELFEREDKLGQEAIDLLSALFKKGRAFGISILWASQNVPRVAGLKDKVLSQIGNKISLRLNNPEDATDIDIDAKKVRDLNRPEKGLGLIHDTRTSADSVEFRVAYAYNSDDRCEVTAKINEKWGTGSGLRDSLFIVGNDAVPLASNPDTLFMSWNQKDYSPLISNVSYMLNLGQDYISGEPFELSLGLRSSRDNLWVAGSDMKIIRDILGYALLSVLINNVKTGTTSQKIYYFNGEYKDPEDSRGLYYVLPEFFKDSIAELKSKDEFIEAIRKLYLMMKERADNIQTSYSPVFFFIHKLQAHVELFRSSERIPVNKPYIKHPVKTVSTTSGGMTPPASFTQYDDDADIEFYSVPRVQDNDASEMISFSEMFKTLFTRGADVGIHFVLSTDTPQSIKEFKYEFHDCRNKIILKGVAPATLTEVLETYKGIYSITKEGIAFSYVDGELTKFKPYRYVSNEDDGWLMKIKNELYPEGTQ